MTSLKVYPIRFSRNVKKVMENANEVGRGFMQARDSKLLAHTGWAFVPEQNETNFVFVSGDVVIDFEEKFMAHLDWKPVRKLPSTRYRRGRMNQGTAECLASPEAVNASRAADPALVQPAKPLTYPGWVNQYPSQSSFAPPQAQPGYNLAAGPPPVTSLYQQPQQPQYVL
ncbi:hypothetical protein BDV34DRAFT_228252 [Aspergillus parasiticus]|uniref:Uncharacterized protein n=1 Tax=Aspergillus parasiticus TaxID=5067 RepID=A0A5N6DBK3_ASPPA|nr:hypothetical protein BDV34DRAFT_228252 [Aspergillus parasiticus]